MSKIYADDSSELRTYDAFNRLATITDARGVVKTHTCDVARGLLLSESYSNETNNRTYVYNFLAMPVQISDDAGVRNFAYNSFNELETEEQCKLSFFVHPSLWLITWDPTQPVATRPLAIQKDGTWYTYGWDLTKNICEIFGPSGYIRSTYAYTPFGSITTSGDINQPIQWSSEYYDNELALVYYNYRHYNPTDGRRINRDPIAEQGGRNLYEFVYSYVSHYMDYVGMGTISSKATILFSPKTIIPYIDMQDIYIGSYVQIHPDDGVVKCCLKKINKRHCSIVCNYMINATMVIDIDEAVVNDKFSVEKLIGIFGHEQKHLKNIIEYIKEESNFVNNINVPDNLSNTDIGRVKEIKKC